MKLRGERRRSKNIKAGELVGVPEKVDIVFDPTKDISPTLVGLLKEELDKIKTRPIDYPEPDEELFILESYQHIKPEELKEYLVSIEKRWHTLMAILKKNIGGSTADRLYVERLFVSLCHFFPHKINELRSQFSGKMNLFRFDETNPSHAIAKSLLEPSERANLASLIEGHVEEINQRLNVLRTSMSGPRWSEFAELFGDVLLLCPQIKGKLEISPQDIGRMKKILEKDEAVDSDYDLARLVKGLTYYTAPGLSMSPEGEINLGYTPVHLAPTNPLPGREIV